MSINPPTDHDRFCVMFASNFGPNPSFWRDAGEIIYLLSCHCNRNCGQGVSIWERRSARGKWFLISSSD